MLETVVLFAGVALVAIALPGPTVLLALGNGARHGVALSLAGMAGAMVSDVVLVSAAALGMGALLAASELAFTVVKWVGAAYLAWLGWRMLRSQRRLELPDAGAVPGEGAARSLFVRSFLVAVTNPKGYLFVSAFFPQFIDPLLPQLTQYLVLGSVFVALDLLVMLAYALTGAHALRWLGGAGLQRLDRLCGGILISLAASLALSRRTA